jgi:cellobiose dehydrogenase (acceptor)
MPNLNTRVHTAPYLRDAADKEAVIKGIEYMRGVLSQVQNLTWITPTVEQNTTAWVNSVSAVHTMLNSFACHSLSMIVY